MKRHFFFILILLTGLQFPVSNLLCQADSLKPRKNILEVFNSRNNALNGDCPCFQREFGCRILMAGWGVDYMRLVGKKNIGLELAFHEWWWARRIDPTNFFDVGTVENAYSSFFATRAHFPILNKSKITWYASNGITFRTGYEVLIVQTGSNTGFWQDEIAIGQSQRDIGLSIGSRFSWQPLSRIVLSADLRYTRFIYRYTTRSEHVPSYKGTSQNLISIQAKLGFAF